MNDLKYDDFEKVEFKLIFDYYDQPLSFIAKIKSNDYLFYYISKSEYFISLVTYEVAKELNEYKDLSKLYKNLEKRKEINVVSFDFEKKSASIIPLDERQDLKEHLPREEDKISYDFKNEMDVRESTNLVKYLDIPNENDASFCVRLFNKSGSHSYPTEIIAGIFTYVTNCYNVICDAVKKVSDNLFSTSNGLYVSPFQKGSFKINFEIYDPELREKLYQSISQTINKVNNVSGTPDFDFLEEEANKEIFINTEDMYNNIIVKKNIGFELSNNINDGKENVNIQANQFVSDNFKTYSNYLTNLSKKRENKCLKTRTVDTAYFTSASINRNMLTFIDLNEKDKKQKAEFDSKLFKKIKYNSDRGYRLILKQPVMLNIREETKKSKNDSETEIKNVITSYQYKEF